MFVGGAFSLGTSICKHNSRLVGMWVNYLILISIMFTIICIECLITVSLVSYTNYFIGGEKSIGNIDLE